MTKAKEQCGDSGGLEIAARIHLQISLLPRSS